MTKLKLSLHVIDSRKGSRADKVRLKKGIGLLMLLAAILAWWDAFVPSAVTSTLLAAILLVLMAAAFDGKRLGYW